VRFSDVIDAIVFIVIIPFYFYAGFAPAGCGHVNMSVKELRHNYTPKRLFCQQKNQGHPHTVDNPEKDRREEQETRGQKLQAFDVRGSI
jgi:hypothetical protein